MTVNQIKQTGIIAVVILILAAIGISDATGGRFKSKLAQTQVEMILPDYCLWIYSGKIVVGAKGMVAVDSATVFLEGKADMLPTEARQLADSLYKAAAICDSINNQFKEWVK